MIKNYFKIAWRNIKRNKLFSLINVISLSVGISAAIVIGMMVYYESTFDDFHSGGDRIYRVVSDFEEEDDLGNFGAVAAPLRREVALNVSGIEESAYFFIWYIDKSDSQDGIVSIKGTEDYIFTQRSYFDLFNYEWLLGKPESALSGPNKVVLTKERAETYYPNLPLTAIIGKQITYQNEVNAEITGIVKTLSGRSDLIFNEFISLDTAKQVDAGDQIFTDEWGNTNSASQLFIKIAAGTNQTQIQEQLTKISKAHISEYDKKYNSFRHFKLQPLADLHFNKDYGVFNYSRSQADKDVLFNLSLVALLLLLLGCINFVNLNTALATKRAQEIGIRKTLGSSRKRLVFQFLGETFLLSSISLAVSLGFTNIILNSFVEFVPDGLSMNLLTNPVVISFMVLLLIIITVASGFYPGIVLSRFKPSEVLKGQTIAVGNNSKVRKVLTIFQFTIAQVFIIATLIVGKQINFLLKKDVGFKKDAIAYFETPYEDEKIENRLLIKTELQSIPEIDEISLAMSGPSSLGGWTTVGVRKTDEGKIQNDVSVLIGDENYLNTYNIPIIAGRKPLNDTINEYLINEAGVRAFGFQSPTDIVGEQIEINNKLSPIVGVIRDFNQRSLKESIKPIVIRPDMGGNKRTSLKEIHFSLHLNDSKTWENVLLKIEKAYKKVYPAADFKVSFIDEKIAQFYEQEQRISKLLSWATGLSILISCLGLLGLVIYTTERRTKEIGIRKVLGASLTSLNTVLCKDFIVLIGIAVVIAFPLVFWGLTNWLQDYAYRTEISLWIFIASGFGMLLIALLVMSFNTLNTARRNPVKSLRTE
ncbi:ABC transporter permease [Gangjinia marincola]|uniref:ABC transporter permease n=1 Tax=Gangjinia marincola TaxID=578463 RepID=A0ABN1MGS9_9FLAO